MSVLQSVVLSSLMLMSAPGWSGKFDAKVETGSVQRVAIVNRVPEGLNYTHLGLTAFGNEDRVLDVDWKPAQLISAALDSALQEGGIEVEIVQLTEAEEAPAFGKKCWTFWNDKYKPACQSKLNALLDRLNVDLLIVLSPYSIQDYYYGSRLYVSGLGVYTAGVGDRIKQSVVVSHVNYRQFSRKGPVYGDWCSSTLVDGERDFTATPNTFGPDDVDWVRSELQRLAQENADRVLRGSGVLPGGKEECPYDWGRH